MVHSSNDRYNQEHDGKDRQLDDFDHDPSRGEVYRRDESHHALQVSSLCHQRNDSVRVEIERKCLTIAAFTEDSGFFH